MYNTAYLCFYIPLCIIFLLSLRHVNPITLKSIAFKLFKHYLRSTYINALQHPWSPLGALVNFIIHMYSQYLWHWSPFIQPVLLSWLFTCLNT